MIGSEPQNQTELVEQDLLNQERGKQIVDYVSPPGCENIFDKGGAVVSTRAIPVYQKDPNNVSFQDLATSLVEAVMRVRGAASIEWKLREPTVEVGVSPGFEQRALTVAQRDHAVSVLRNVLKSRNEIRAFKWVLGTPEIEVQYIVP